MPDGNQTLALRVPGPLERTFSGIVVRDGRFYWSGWTMFWRLALAMFAVKVGLRVALLGLPGMSMPAAGASAVSTIIVAAVFVLIARGQRRRFNAAAPRVLNPTRRERDGIE